MLIKIKVLFKQFDEKRNNFEETFIAQLVYEFIEKKSMPVLRSFDKKIAKLVFVDYNISMIMLLNMATRSI